MIRRVLTAVLLATVALAPVASRAADPFEIHVVLPLTGPGAFLGKAEVDMLGVLEGQVNRSGGIQGQPLKFNVHDDQSSPQQGVQIMTALVAQHVPVVFGSALVAICNAMYPIAKDSLVHYCLSTGFHPPDGSLGFANGVSTVDQVAAGLRYLRDRGLKKVAVITSSDATGVDADRIFDALVTLPEFSGVTIATHEHFAIGDVSVAAQMTRIRAAGAQAIVGWTTGSPLGTLLHGVTDAGLALPFVGGSGNLTYAQMKAYAAIMPRETYFPGVIPLAPEAAPNGPFKRTVLEYRAAFKAAGIHPDIANALGWDQVMMVVTAFRKFGTSATPVQIRDFIVGANWKGIAGQYDFKLVPQRGLGSNAIVMLQWIPEKDDWTAVSRIGGGLK